MEYYTIKNWHRFQHYTKRNPPWIKLHYEIMTSSDWVMLADASKLLAIACMLIASRNNGQVPANHDFVKRVAYLDNLPDFKPLLDSGFLEKVLADASNCKQMQANACPETETEKERYIPESVTQKSYSDEFEVFWQLWPKHRRCEKPKAYQQWKIAIRTATFDNILRGARDYIETKEAKDGYAPYPAKWLKGERWAENHIRCKPREVLG